LSLGELQTLAETPDLLEGIEVLWLMSHLACAAMPDHPLNTQQLKHFETAQAIFPQWPSSFANSSGVFLGEAFHGELARPGAALYGINPTPAAKNPMRNVVTIKAPVLQVRQLHAPETVGYDATYVAPENATLATVACGYADGALRRMSNVSHVWIAGQKAPVAGIISMDVAVIDITNLPQHAVNAGDMVEFIGENIMLDIVADQAGTIGYEVLTNICPRVRRCYINNRE
jgi:alanine racemase